jgi:hypothetical protein
MWGTSLLRNASSRSLAEGAKPVPERPAGPESPTQRRSSVGRRSTRRAGLTPSARWGRSGCGLADWFERALPRAVGTGLSRVKRSRPHDIIWPFAGERPATRSHGSRSSTPQFATDSRGLWPQNSALANYGGIVGTASETVARGSPATCSGGRRGLLLLSGVSPAALHLTFVGVTWCCGIACATGRGPRVSLHRQDHACSSQAKRQPGGVTAKRVLLVQCASERGVGVGA